jgi:hypothetical protein
MQAATNDRAAKARLGNLDAELAKLKGDQKAIGERWRLEKDEMNKLQYYKEEIERVNLEVQQAERDYDLNRWVFLGSQVCFGVGKCELGREMVQGDWKGDEG